MVLSYDALFSAEQLPVPGLDELLGAALGSAGAQPGLAVGTAPVLRHVAPGEWSGPRGWWQGGHTLGREGWHTWTPSLQRGRSTPVLCSSPARPASPACPGRTGT